jgi:hypothetical protein
VCGSVTLLRPAMFVVGRDGIESSSEGGEFT